MGLPPGRHHLGTMEVNIEKNRATLVGTSTLAGRLADLLVNIFSFIVLKLETTEPKRYRDIQSHKVFESTIIQPQSAAFCAILEFEIAVSS